MKNTKADTERTPPGTDEATRKMEQIELQSRMEIIGRKILVLSGKGGVGKSTVAANLAIALSQKAQTVGLLDIDLHGPSIPNMLGIQDKKPHTTKDGLQPIIYSKNLKVMSMGFLVDHPDQPVIWRGPMKMGAIKQLLSDVDWGDLEYLIVDLPPGTGDEPLSIIQLLTDCDGAIIVTTPQDIALISVKKSINFVKKMQIPIIGIIENMSGFTCPHCGNTIDVFKTDGGVQTAKQVDIPFLGKIPLDPSIAVDSDKGQPFFNTTKEGSTKEAFETIVKNIEKEIKKR